jgi:hypothetical protein
MKNYTLRASFRVFSRVVSTVVLMTITTVSHATTLSFENITNNNNVDLTGQLSVDVNSIGTTGVEFTFYNNVGLDSSLTDIYFDLGSNLIFSDISITNDSDGLASIDDVYFKEGAKTPVLPGANGNPLNFTSDYDAGAKNVKKGLDQGGEWITFLATLGTDVTSGNTFTYADFMAGLFDGTYRIGVKLQSIEDACPTGVDDCANDSDSYVNVVPVPAAGILFASALFGLGVIGRRKKKLTKTTMVSVFTRTS